MIDLSATLIGYASFVLVVLTICGVAYYNADSLQSWAESKLKKSSDDSRL